MPPRPTGSLRERRPGVWEIRIAVATDPITGRTVQSSFTFRGDRQAAEVWCRELADEFAQRRAAPAIPTLVDPAAITLAGQLQYVDQQHVAVLLFALGQYPVPEVFQSTAKAASPG